MYYLYNINSTFPERVIVENIIPRNMIINQGTCDSRKYHPEEYDYQPRHSHKEWSYLELKVTKSCLMSAIAAERLLTWTNRRRILVAHHVTRHTERLIISTITRCYGKWVTLFATAIAVGDSLKYHSFVYGSFVWGIHVRYNNVNCFVIWLERILSPYWPNLSS